MKFKNFKQKLGLKNFGNKTISPDVQHDSRGFPHVCWFEEQNGEYSVHYKYWNGNEWSFIGDNSIVFYSQSPIILSSSSLFLINGKPVIGFIAKKDEESSTVYLFRGNFKNWKKEEYDLNVRASWFSIFYMPKPKNIQNSSSSSSTSSSSSYDINTEFVVGIADNSTLYMYELNSSEKLLNSIDISSYDLTKLKATGFGELIYFGVIHEGSIQVNAFNVYSGSWSSSDFSVYTPTNGTLYSTVSFVMQPYYANNNYCLISWGEINNSFSKLQFGFLSSSLGASNTTTLESLVSINKGKETNNAFKNIAINSNQEGDNIWVLSCGSKSKIYKKSGLTWDNGEEISLEGKSDGFIFSDLDIAFFDPKYRLLINSNNNVYYLEDTSSSSDNYPSMWVLNKERTLHSRMYQEDSITFDEILCSWNAREGDIIKEAHRRNLISINEEEDPECGTSSSSSSDSSASIESDSSFSSLSSLSSSSSSFEPSCSSPECSLEIGFKTYTVPDRLYVRDGTGIVFDTGFISTGDEFREYSLVSLSCPVQVCVEPHPTIQNTFWDLKLNGCGLYANYSGSWSPEPICFGEACYVKEILIEMQTKVDDDLRVKIDGVTFSDTQWNAGWYAGETFVTSDVPPVVNPDVPEHFRVVRLNGPDVEALSGGETVEIDAFDGWGSNWYTGLWKATVTFSSGAVQIEYGGTEANGTSSTPATGASDYYSTGPHFEDYYPNGSFVIEECANA